MAADNQTDMNNFIVPKKYTVLPGAIDYGKEYEVKLATLFSLRCTHSDNDMWIGMNIKDCGNFDDIVLYRRTRTDKHVTIMMQAKHEEKERDLTQQQLSAERGDFSLKKYSLGLSAIQEAIDGDTKKSPIINHLKQEYEKLFVIFTNKGVPAYKFLPKVKESDLNILNINGTIRKLNSHQLPFEFQMNEKSQEFMKNLFFFTKQSSIQELNKPITDAMEKLLEPLKLSAKNMSSLVVKFTTFVDDWSKGHLGGHYPLTKAHVLKVLASLLLEQYEVELEEPTEDGTFEITVWHEIIKAKTVTIIKADGTSTQFVNQYIHNIVSENLKNSEMNTLWTKNITLVNKTMLKVIPRHRTMNVYDVYEYLWKSNRVPLILKVSDTKSLNNLQQILKISAGAFRLIILTEIDSDPPLLNLHNSFRNLQDLNEQHRQKVLRCSIKLQGRICNALETLITEELYPLVTVKDIIYILSGKFNIGKDADPLPDFFVDRSIPKIYIRGAVLEEVETDMFLIKCASSMVFNKFLDKYKVHIPNSSIFQKYKTEIDAHILNKFRIIISDQDVDLGNIKADSFENKALHCLVLHDCGYLEWKSSLGSIKAISPFRFVDQDLNDSEIELDKTTVTNPPHAKSSYSRRTFKAASGKRNVESLIAKEFLEVYSRKSSTIPLVISADPGMGKSVLMDYIALNISTNVWVVRINLIQHLKYYNREDFENLKSDEHLHYFNTSISTDDKMGWSVFKIYQERKNIILLFDGFDEIPIVFQDNVLRIVKSLHDSGYLVCLTTRPVAKIQLEEVLNTFAVNIVPFSKTNQITFLVNYFDTFVTSYVENRIELIKLFVNKLLNTTKRNFNAFDNEFMGVPLQTKLLADVFADHCKTFLSSNTFDVENFDVLYLYKNFIAKKVRIICDKFGESSMEEYNDYMHYRSLLALQLLFEENDLKELEISKLLEAQFIRRMLQKVQKDGLVVAESESNIWFAHRTFAEYLSAQWLSKNINGEYKTVVKKLVRKLFFPNYSVVRNLYDRILAQGCAVHLDIINNGCTYKVKQTIVSNPYIKNEVDKSGRTLLHLVASRGIQHPDIVKSREELRTLNWKLETDPALNCIRTLCSKLPRTSIRDRCGYTPLDYALFSRSYHTATTICAHLQNFNDCVCDSSNSKLIYEYLKNNDFEYRALKRVLFKSFVSTDINTTIANLRLIKDRFPTSGTTMNADGSDDSYPPLQVAIMLEEKEIIKSLVCNTSHVNFQDYTGKTALHWASANGDVHSVNILLSKNANVNVTDNIMGMTPIHYAFLVTTHNQKDIVSLLLEKEAAVNIQDNDGNTALQYCVYYSHIDTLQTVINYITKQNIPAPTSRNSNVAEDRDYFVVLDALLHNRNSTGETIGHWAAETNLIAVLSLFKDYPELSITKNDNGDTPLHFAAMRGHAESAALLLSNSIALRDSLCNRLKLVDARTVVTPLHFVVENAHLEIVSLLLSNGAYLDAKNNNNGAALHYAAGYGHLDVVSLLLSKGAAVNVKTNENWSALHLAAQHGHLDIVPLLLSKDADVDAIDNNNWSALHIAAANGYLDIVSLLLSKGCDADAKTNETSSALHVAAQNGHFDIVSLLLSKVGDVDAKGNQNWSALHLAAQNGHLDVVSLLLSREVDVDARENQNWSALHLAAQNGHLDIVSLLLSKGASVDVKTNENWSALHLAAQHGHLDVVSLLLSKGVDVDGKGNKNWSALHLAAQNGHLDVVSLLLSKGVDVDSKGNKNWSALHLAAQNGHLNIMSLLLSKGATVDAKDNDNWSTLHLAAQNGHLDIVSLLFSRGVDVDGKGNKNWSALHLAAQNGHLAIVSLLLSTGSDVNAKDTDNWSALHRAAKNGHLDIVSLLLSNGGDVDAKGNQNWSALHLAAENGHLDIVSLLLSKRIDVDAKTNNNWSALHLAAQNGHLAIVSLLLSTGSDVNAKDTDNWSALHRAAQNGHLDIVSLLLSNGGDVDAKGNQNWSALHLAAENGHLDIVSLLLSKRFDVDAKTNNNWSALHIAAQNGRLDIVSLLLSKGIDVDAKTNKNSSALKIATQNGHLDIVSLLLSKGADVQGLHY